MRCEPDRRAVTEPEVPWARLVLLGLGSAVAVLVLAAGLITWLNPGPVLGLIIGLGGLIGCVLALAVVSRRVTATALHRSERPGP